MAFHGVAFSKSFYSPVFFRFGEIFSFKLYCIALQLYLLYNDDIFLIAVAVFEQVTY